ncbi:hypothetical protein TNCV_1465071 [Trichonephila clavipes]|nr:hypothetical protein TNCV_1465071 [Trichonephila clavipes]
MCVCSEEPLAQTSFLRMTMHGHIGPLVLRSYWKVKISLEWIGQPYSPDLNPFEHVWDALEKRIRSTLTSSENTQQLKQMRLRKGHCYRKKCCTS